MMSPHNINFHYVDMHGRFTGNNLLAGCCLHYDVIDVKPMWRYRENDIVSVQFNTIY